jgi:peptidoglycan/LPS O-acetylase OafA/YrhL
MQPVENARGSASSHRPEIQGIRALAALLVATFHIWLGRVSGGVDVFIVVSGFLITTSLLGQAERYGRIDFVKFWAGLARRLLPAALTVLLAIVMASWLWLPKARWGDTIREVAASALYVENWQLAFSAVDYLDRENAVSPLQHFWALSVQGQFYLLWPLLVAAAIVLAARMGRPLRGTLFSLLAVAFVGSLAYSIYATAANQPFAYFNTFARIWEFSAGGLLAIALPSLSLPVLARTLLGWIGVIGMLTCGVVLQVGDVFPGYAALWPTLAAVMIIVAGTSGSAVGADRLLGSRPLVAIGDISYGIYLWHWPILIFYRSFVDGRPMGLLDGIVILVPSILLAWLTTRYVEAPIRAAKGRDPKPGRTLRFAGAALAGMLMVTGAWAAHYLEARAFDRRSVVLGSGDYPGAMALEDGFQYAGAPNVPVYPGPLYVRRDLPDVYADECHQQHESSEVIRCEYGRSSAARTIAIVGGSHAVQWLPALQIFAEKEDWKLLSYTKASCQFTTSAVSFRGEYYASCTEWNAMLLAELAKIRPEIVFTTSTRGSAAAAERVDPGDVRQWEALREMGIRVIALRDNPWMGFEVSECVERRGAAALACRRPRAAMLAASDPTDSLAAPDNVGFIDLTRYFCDSAWCFPAAGNVLIYRDRHHITASYAKTLAPALERAMRKVHPDVFSARSPVKTDTVGP